MSWIFLALIGFAFFISVFFIPKFIKEEKSQERLAFAFYVFTIIFLGMSLSVPFFGEEIYSKTTSKEFEITKIDLFKNQLEFLNTNNEINIHNIMYIDRIEVNNNIEIPSYKKITYDKTKRFLIFYFKTSDDEYVLETPKNIYGEGIIYEKEIEK